MSQLTPALSNQVRETFAKLAGVEPEVLTPHASLVDNLGLEGNAWMVLLMGLDQHLGLKTWPYWLQVERKIRRVSDTTVGEEGLAFLKQEFPNYPISSDQISEIYTYSFIEALVANVTLQSDLPYQAIDLPTGQEWGQELVERYGDQKFRKILADALKLMFGNVATYRDTIILAIEALATFAETGDRAVLEEAHATIQSTGFRIGKIGGMPLCVAQSVDPEDATSSVSGVVIGIERKLNISHSDAIKKFHDLTVE